LTASTDDRRPPVLGRPSPAAAAAAVLRARGDAPYAAYRVDGGDGEWCAIRVASIAGVRHRLAGLPVQDSFAWAADGQALAVAVADGLGGVPGSDTTAGRAAWAAVEAAAGDVGPLSGRVVAAVAAANRAARGGGATTLVIAVLDRHGAVALARVGDSSAFVVGADDASWQELFAPPAGDAIGSTTAALPADDVQPEATTLTLEDGRVLVLATDGIADPWRDGPSTVAPVLAAALAHPPAPLDLAQLADFSRQGCHDDRTLLAVWPHPGIAAPPPAG
jgi:serine/threonine protein phosphatase PrpC